MNDEWHWDDMTFMHFVGLAILAVSAVATVMGWVFFAVGMVQIWMR
jgi:hypothetical protein